MSNPFVTTGALAFGSAVDLERAVSQLAQLLGRPPTVVAGAPGVAGVVVWAKADKLEPSAFEPGLAALGELSSFAAQGSALWALGGAEWVTELRIAEAETAALEASTEAERSALRERLRKERRALGVERPDELLANALWEGRRGWLQVRGRLADDELIASLVAFDARRALGESFGLRKLDRASFDELHACVGDRVLVLCTFVDGPYRLDARKRVLEVLAERAPTSRAVDELVAFAALDPTVSKRATELLSKLPPAEVAARCASYLDRKPARYPEARAELEQILVRVAGVLAALPPSAEVSSVAAKGLRRKVNHPAYASLLTACVDASGARKKA